MTKLLNAAQVYRISRSKAPRCKGWKVVGMESLREKSGMRMDDKEKEKSILGKKNRKKERVE